MTSPALQPSQAALSRRFADFAAQRERAEPALLTGLRRSAFRDFARRGLPSTREEEWRFTDTSPLNQMELVPAPPHGNGVVGSTLPELSYDGVHRIVLVNGRLDDAWTEVGSLPEGVSVSSLLAAGSDALDRLGQGIPVADAPFAALNTAFFEDAIVIRVAAGVDAGRPLHVISLTASGEPEATSYPRLLVIAETGARARVIETHAGPSGATYLNCPVTEIFVDAGADVDHYKVQAESLAAFHMGLLQVHQAARSRFATHSISTGGRLVRHDVRARLEGEGADAILNGLYVVEGEQVVDTHMLVEHMAPHCTSLELYKGILDGRSRGVFNGRIFVAPDAQATDAVQSNRNVLLSREALVNSNPQLEIFANDVRCTHGSTVGQLDRDAVFYLRSRGISLPAAKSILVWAFAAEIVDGIRDTEVRARLSDFLFARLPGGEVVRQAV
jgi:Fe-S cluster assembly protein SufD